MATIKIICHFLESLEINNAVGKPINKGALVGMDQKEWYIGHEAKAKS